MKRTLACLRTPPGTPFSFATDKRWSLRFFVLYLLISLFMLGCDRTPDPPGPVIPSPTPVDIVPASEPTKTPTPTSTPSPSPSPTMTPLPPGILQGRVETPDGEAVVDATVRLDRGSDHLARSTTTSPDGSFLFRDVEGTGWHLTASHPDYWSLPRPEIVLPDDQQAWDHPRLLLDPGSLVVEGKVTDSLGRPIAEATVQVFSVLMGDRLYRKSLHPIDSQAIFSTSPEPINEVTDVAQEIPLAARSDRNGHYRLDRLAPGNYLLQAEAEGFSTAYREGAEPVSSRTLQIDFKLEPGAEVSGRVLSTTNQPLADAAVLLYREHPTPFRQQILALIHSATDGAYRFSGVPTNENLQIFSWRNGWISNPREVSFDTWFEKKTDVDLVLGSPNSFMGRAVDLQTNSVLPIRSFEFKPDPETSRLIHLVQSITGLQASPLVGGNLRLEPLRLERLFPGRYHLTVQGDSNRLPYENHYTFQIGMESRWESFPLEQAPALWIEVLDQSTNIPMSQVQIQGFYSKYAQGIPHELSEQTTDREGRILIQPFPDGHYRILARREGYRQAKWSLENEPGQTHPGAPDQWFQFDPEFPTTLTIRMSRRPTGQVKLSGTVQTTTAQTTGAEPVPGAKVQAWTMDRWEMIAETVADTWGNFTLQKLPQMPLRLVANSEGFHPNERMIHLRKSDVSIENLELFLQPVIEKTIQGIVVDPNDHPVPGARVTALGASEVDLLLSGIYRHDQTLDLSFVPAWFRDYILNLDRSAPPPTEWLPVFSSRSEGDGRFRLSVDQQSGVLLFAQHQDFLFSSHKMVHSKNDHEVRLVLKPLVKLEGRVVDMQTSRPVPKFTLSLKRIDDLHSSRVVEKTFQDSQGRFLLHLPFPPPYQLYCKADGFTPYEQLIYLPFLEIDIQMDPIGSEIGGRVLLKDIQAPVPAAQVETMGIVTQTGQDGRFRIRGIPRSIEHNLDLTITGPRNRRRTISVSTEKLPVDLGDIYLDAQYSISGFVIGPDGIPLSDIQVILMSPMKTSLDQTLVWTGADGAYAFELLREPADQFHHLGLAYGPGYGVESIGKIWHLQDISNLPGDSLTVSFYFDPAATVLGRVDHVEIWQGKIPTLLLFDHQEKTFFIADIDQQGYFQFDMVPPGDYRYGFVIGNSAPEDGGTVTIPRTNLWEWRISIE